MLFSAVFAITSCCCKNMLVYAFLSIYANISLGYILYIETAGTRNDFYLNMCGQFFHIAANLINTPLSVQRGTPNSIGSLKFLNLAVV